MEIFLTYHVHSQTVGTISPFNLLHNLIAPKCTKTQKEAILSVIHLKDDFSLIYIQLRAFFLQTIVYHKYLYKVLDTIYLFNFPNKEGTCLSYFCF